MTLPFPTPKGLLANKGYNGDRFLENLLLRRIPPVIPPRSNRKVPAHPDDRRSRDRNRIARMPSQLKGQYRIATRHDKTATAFESPPPSSAPMRAYDWSLLPRRRRTG